MKRIVYCLFLVLTSTVLLAGCGSGPKQAKEGDGAELLDGAAMMEAAQVSEE